jgi:hypothetical protein
LGCQHFDGQYFRWQHLDGLCFGCRHFDGQ